MNLFYVRAPLSHFMSCPFCSDGQVYDIQTKQYVACPLCVEKARKKEQKVTLIKPK